MTHRRRVAITGIGLVTPVGNDAPTTWANLIAGKSGVASICGFDASSFPSRIGAEVKNFDDASLMVDRKQLKFASRSHRFALAAAEEALRDAGVRPEPATGHRWGFSVGAGMMCVTFDEVKVLHAHCGSNGEFNPDALLDRQFPADPVAFCRSQTNAGLALLTRQFGIQGYATAVHTACASGGQALGTALKAMRRGHVDFVLAYTLNDAQPRHEGS